MCRGSGNDEHAKNYSGLPPHPTRTAMCVVIYMHTSPKKV